MLKFRHKIIAAITLSCFLTFISAGFFPLARAQEKKRLKIGLVLGGGGARGAAHVGILKVLEENNVPVDYIAGTSMGAIVGGLYASGMSPESIEELFNATDWQDIFSDRPSEKYLSFRHKQDQKQLMDFEMGVKKGRLVLPRGVISGQKLDFELKKLTLPVADIDNFDNLPIPFRAISADLSTGEMIIHSRGNLSEAIRASMSIPGAFSPVKIDGRVLVDGGIVNNLPIEVVKGMGADIIIAVDVGKPLKEAEKLNSLVDITMQVLNIMTMKNVNDSVSLLTEEDILIRPDLGNIGVSSFSRSPEAIRNGEEAARKMADRIKQYSVSPEVYKSYLARQRSGEAPPIKIDFIEVKSPSRVSPKAIKGRIKTRAGEILDLKKLEQDLTRIYAMGDFETVDFKIIEKESEEGLLIDTQEKEWGPNYLRFGLNLLADSDGNSEFTLLNDYRMTQINSLGGEWKNVLNIGRTTGIFSEFYQPLDIQSYFFVSPQISAARFLEDIYEEGSLIAEYRVDYIWGGVDMGVNLGSFAEGRLGLRRGVVQAEPEVGGSNLPSFSDIQEGAIVAQLEYDQLDNHKFPKQGIFAGVDFFSSNRNLGSDFSYQKLECSLVKATTFGNKHTVILLFNSGISLDEETPFYDEFTLGGFLGLSGYGEKQLRGQHMGLFDLVYFYNIAKTNGFVTNVYIGGSFEAGNVWNNRRDIKLDDLLFGGTVLIGIDTKIGPLYLGFGQSEDSPDGKAYLFLGQIF